MNEFQRKITGHMLPVLVKRVRTKMKELRVLEGRIRQFEGSGITDDDAALLFHCSTKLLDELKALRNSILHVRAYDPETFEKLLSIVERLIKESDAMQTRILEIPTRS